MPTTSFLQLLDAITRKGSEIGVKLVPSGGRTPALHFDFGFKIRSFFPRLVELRSQPRNKLDEQAIDEQGTDCRSMTPTKVSVHTAERGFFALRFRLRSRGYE
ncbi:MAG: hypothetical protein ACXU84_09385 [Xanthobacteraceae bacterium]